MIKEINLTIFPLSKHTGYVLRYSFIFLHTYCFNKRKVQLTPHEVLENNEQIFFNYQHHHDLLFDQTTQMVSVVVRLSGYSPRFNIPSSTLYPTVESKFDFKLYQPISIDPSKMTIYYHSDNTVKLTISGGSGDYQSNVNGSRSIIEVKSAGTSSLSIKPMQEGLVTLKVFDSCVPLLDAVSCDIIVSDIHALSVSASDVLQVQRKMDLQVKALDLNGEPFHSSQYKYMEFTYHIDNKEALTSLSHPLKNTTVLQGLSPATVHVVVSSKTMTVCPFTGFHIYNSI